MASVLITDGLLRKSLAVTRSLGKKGIEVTIGEKTRFTISGYSKYCKKILRYPDPQKDPDTFLNWMSAKLSERKWDVLFPMDDVIMDLAVENVEQWSKYCRLVVPPAESYIKVRDKYQSMLIAEQSGLNCPKTILPHSIQEVHEIAQNLSYPLIIKPRFESGSRGIRVIHTENELLDVFENGMSVDEFPMIQEYIPQGIHYDVCLLFDHKNELKAHFLQKEIRHFPIKMGPSTVQQSIRDDHLLEKCLSFMKNLPWYGIVELEFMENPYTGQLVFMEVNPRFWNSLACAIDSGVDFPFLMYKLAMGEDIQNVFSYETNVYCRNLLPGDLLHFISNRGKVKMNPPLFFRNGQKVIDDILSVQDLMPLIGFILTCFRYVFSISEWKKLIKR